MSFKDKVFHKYLNDYSDSNSDSESNSSNNSYYTNKDPYLNIENLSYSYEESESNIDLLSISDYDFNSDSENNNDSNSIILNNSIIYSDIQNEYVKKHNKKESFLHILFNLIKKLFKSKKKNKRGKGTDKNDISYQYDISDLVNEIK